MKKKVGIIKRNVAILLIIAMSINSFGAIVSDNDGSAFITKSEFDALKASFQSQIDSYNNSIDSKIDGAIAAYLAGITISNTRIETTLNDYSGGARSIVADTWTLGTAGSYTPGGMNWSNGRVQVNFTSQQTEINNTNTNYADTSVEQFCSYIIKISPKALTTFKERLVENFDETSGQASWHGYCTTEQYVTGTTYEVKEVTTADHLPLAWKYNGSAVVGTGTETDPFVLKFMYFLLGNFSSGANTNFAMNVASDRTPLTNKTEGILHWRVAAYSISNNNKTGWENQTSNFTFYVGTAREMKIPCTGLSYERKIQDVAEKYIILCDNDLEYKVSRLNDMDLVSGWTNETDAAFSTGHSLASKIDNIAGVNVTFIGTPGGLNTVNKWPIYVTNNGVFQAYWKEADTDRTWFKISATQYITSGGSTTTGFPKSQYPYFGFMNEISDWRKISNKNYNSIVDIAAITAAQQEGSSSVMLNHDGTELMIGAGLPVIKLEKDKKYTFTMKADTGGAPDETGDYYIWFKDGTFTDGKKPQNEANLYEVTGISKDSVGYILPKGTTKEVTLEATRDGYLFCKWRCKDLNGGGILYIDKNVTCTSLN